MKARRPGTRLRPRERRMFSIRLEVNISPATSRRLQVENQERITKVSRTLVVTRLSRGELH